MQGRNLRGRRKRFEDGDDFDAGDEDGGGDEGVMLELVLVKVRMTRKELMATEIGWLAWLGREQF